MAGPETFQDALAVPDESQKVEDVGKAQAMAEAGDLDRTAIAKESAVNGGKEFSQFKNHERAAEYAEGVAGAKHEMEERVKDMTDRELAQERAKIATLLKVLQIEEVKRNLREATSPNL